MLSRTVEDGTCTDVCVELALGSCKQGHVQLLLGRREVVFAHDDRPRRKAEIIGALKFGTTEHHAIEQDLFRELCRSREPTLSFLKAMAPGPSLVIPYFWIGERISEFCGRQSVMMTKARQRTQRQTCCIGLCPHLSHVLRSEN